MKSKIGNINTKLSRTVYKDAANVNAAQMKKVFKNEIVKVSNIDESIFNEVKNILKKEEIITLIKKKDEIEKVGDAYKEACDYTNKYLLDIFNALDGHYDQTTTICPVCWSINVPLYNIIEEKKKQLQEISNNVFKDFDSIVAKSKEEQITIIQKIFDLSSKLSKENFLNIYKTYDSYDEYNSLYKECLLLSELEQKLNDLESKRESFYNEMSNNSQFVKKNFETIYPKSSIKFDPSNKEIKIDLPREYLTYSTGELDEMILVIRLLAFKGSDKKTLIIDDPLSSFDFSNQYRIMFRLVDVTNNNTKNVIIFTHNIDTINISNTQYNSVFKYFYMDKYKGNLYLEKIEINCRNSIFSLESLQAEDNYIKLLVYRENLKDGASFEGNKVFHYDSNFIFHSTNEDEKVFDGLSNQFLFEKIDNLSIEYTNSFISNTVAKIVHLSAIRVWIEKQLFDFINSIDNDEEKEKLMGEFTAKYTTVEKVKCIEKNSKFMEYFPNYNRKNFMMKKVMLNQNLHYKSQIIPFNFAINISFDNLVSEIEEIKDIFSKN